MITKHERHISYICPVCNSVTTRVINPFVFSGRKSINIKCSKKGCETACVNIHDHKGAYMLEAFCPICSTVHSDTVAKGHFWNNPLTSLTCEESGIDMIFVGELDKIKRAWDVFEHKCNELEEEEIGFFDDFEPDTDDDFLAEALCTALELLSLLSDINEIQCRCGSRKVGYTVIDNKIGFKCSHCKSIAIKEPSEDLLHSLAESAPYIFNS